MPIPQKQSININFSQGLDTKTDPWQVPAGKFLELENTVFNKGGQLQKRNGYGSLTSLPNESFNTLTTYGGNLVAIGNSLSILSQSNQIWYNKGSFQPLDLSVDTLVRSSLGQTTIDVAVHSTLLACAVYTSTDNNTYYQIVDSSNGQIIVSQVGLPSGAVLPRVFSLGNHFIITYLINMAPVQLRYIAISVFNPTNPGTARVISSQVESISAGYDGIVSENNLYIAWNASDLGGAIRATYIDAALLQHLAIAIPGHNGDLISITSDETGVSPTIWFSFWNESDNKSYVNIFNNTLQNEILPPTLIFTNEIIHLTSSAQNGTGYFFYEVANTYSYSSTESDYIQIVTCSQGGTVGTPSVVLRSVGLASKAFYLPDFEMTYMLVAYGGAFQPTYFLMDQNGNIISKLAYSNGNGYATTQILPSANIQGDRVLIGYLYKSLIVPVNKSQGVSTVAGIYAQNGVNLATFNFTPGELVTAEIAGILLIPGGILWMYDGEKIVEHGFHLWPEDIGISTSGTGGNLSAQQYYYYSTYEWTDATGNIHRSAPSVPYGIVTTGSTSSNTLNIPTLRVTYKTGMNDVRIVIYRWSQAQQIPYQITSISSPILNDPTVDSIQYIDTASDADILGNVILYTNGGIIEDIGPPATATLTLYKGRVILLTAEDRNLLWFSKQVIEATTIEFSDLFTIYVAPTISSQISTGPTEVLGAMDDKLIIFKKEAIYYLIGNGPDNTGAFNDFSDPTFITSAVGCSNQSSIVFISQGGIEGLLFQSEKGIWILGRNLSTDYIGAPVEKFNPYSILSAVNVPLVNQVRFTLNNGTTLMYDYFFGQWGTFTGIPSISSTIYQSLHTYLNEFGQIYQETIGSYLDGSNPVLIAFKSAWFNLAGLQGFERAYEFFALANYISPHFLNVQIAYDYNPYPIQTTLVTPENYNPPYGSDPLYGSSSPYGGMFSVEQWRIFLENKKCQSFQIQLNEVFDSSFGVMAGAGLTLSGINLTIGVKSGSPKLKPSLSAG